MKKKSPAGPIIAPEIMDLARRSVTAERPQNLKPCVVCGSARTSSFGPQQGSDEEDLCWVCRRLKISAWRDAEQASAQE